MLNKCTREIDAFLNHNIFSVIIVCLVRHLFTNLLLIFIALSTAKGFIHSVQLMFNILTWYIYIYIHFLYILLIFFLLKTSDILLLNAIFIYVYIFIFNIYLTHSFSVGQYLLAVLMADA